MAMGATSDDQLQVGGVAGSKVNDYRAASAPLLLFPIKVAGALVGIVFASSERWRLWHGQRTIAARAARPHAPGGVARTRQPAPRAARA